MADWHHSNGSSSSRPRNGQPTPNNSVPPWNPSMLLNPRAYYQTQQPQAPNPSPRNAPTSQLSFEFSNPDNSHARQPSNEASHSMSSTGHAHPSGGFGHMLERMHNVSNRGLLPQKRRKVHDDRSEDGNGVEMGVRRGGILGQYIKDQKENVSREGSSRGAAVDLSADDEEVMVVGDEQEKEVCYGRIENAELNGHQVPTAKEGALAMSPDFWPQVKIILRRRIGDKTNIIHALDSTRATIGTVDVNTSIGLTPILDSQYGIRTASRILTRPRRAGDLPPGTENISCHYSLDLNLYGPKKWAAMIGRHLSQKQLWLRTPLFMEVGMELYNPHTVQTSQQPTARSLTASGSSRAQGPVRTTEEIRSDIIGMFDSLEQSENLPEVEPDPRIVTPLLKHQKQGLYFMKAKEAERGLNTDDKIHNTMWKPDVGNNGEKCYYNVITGQTERVQPPQVRGGILADMMGLGKTLSILSLVVSTLDDSKKWANSPCVQQAPRPESQYNTGKTALPKLGRIPLVQNSKTTLLISPLSTIANWEEQIKQHVKPGTLNYHIYHGSGRTRDIKKLAEYDLVITTYGAVATEFLFRSKGKQGVYPLEEINWFRIVLDEAHMIREQSTQQSRAICRLNCQRQWAVTGTPVQNRLDDLGALMTFLRIRPFDEKGGFAQYIMAPFKMCDPEILPKLRLLVDSITLRRLKDKIDLPARHDQLVNLDFSDEERTVYDVFAKNASDRVKMIVGQREKSLGGKSYVHILQSILRLRLICAHGVDLLSEEDLKVMDGLSKDSAIDLDSDDDDDRPALTTKQAYDMYDLMKETNADVCITCNRKIGPGEAVESDGEPKDEIIGYLTQCYHLLCTACIDKYKTINAEAARGRSSVDCPICQQHIKLSYFALRQGGVEEDQSSSHSNGALALGKGSGNYSGPHTKTKALIHDLLASNLESERNSLEPPIKSVVFSGWTAHLDLIQIALRENGITYTRLDGKMSRTARGHALDIFRHDPAVCVILVSITAGGLGLNLTMANKVYVMEPQYNPAAEAQAVDRVHRLGQKREVVTVRYIMDKSFEEKMLELQEKKKKLASLSMDSRNSMDKAEAARQRLEDLRSLFK